MAENMLVRRALPYGRRRGYIIITAMIVFSILLIYALTDIRAGMTSYNLGMIYTQQFQARQLALAGMDAMIAYADADLSINNTYPAGVTWTYPTTGAWFTSLTNGGEFRAQLVCPSANSVVPSYNVYTITATGKTAQEVVTEAVHAKNPKAPAVAPGGICTITATIVPQNFAQYAYFQDQTEGYYPRTTHFTGPFHTNAEVTLQYTNLPNNLPMFDTASGTGNGNFTTAAAGVLWQGSAPPSNQWGQIIRGGITNMQYNGANVKLPTTSVNQLTAAYGAGPTYPTTTGVYPGLDKNGNLSEGIYIAGSSSIVFSVNGSGNQVITISQGTTTITTYKYTCNLQQNTTSVVKQVGSGSPTTTNYTGVTDGVIYDNSPVTALSGVLGTSYQNGSNLIKNQWMVATNNTSSQSITIAGNLTYTVPNPNAPWTDPTNATVPMLGLYSYNVITNDTPQTINGVESAQYTPQALTVDAFIMANGGEWKSSNYNTYWGTSSTHTMGSVTVNGGVVNTMAGYFSTGSTGRTEAYNYDVRGLVNPPPGEPTVPVYAIQSWQDFQGVPLN
jgi:hypothetical protein